MKVILFGGNGFLGQGLQEEFRNRNIDFKSIDKEDYDLANYKNLNKCIENLKDISEKYNLGMDALSFATSVVDRTKFALGLYARIREGADYDIKQVDYYVFSPRMTSDECIEYVNKHTDELTKKFISAIRKAIKEREEASKFGDEPMVHFNAEGQRLLAKLPAWCRNRVLDLRMERSYWDARNVEYTVKMKPLPNDPDQSTVYLRADNLVDLKYIINEYKKSFKRIEL